MTLKGDLGHVLPRTHQCPFLPSAECHSRKKPTVLALTGTSTSPPCESRSPSSPSLSASPCPLFLAFPQETPGLPGQLPNHRMLELAFRDLPSTPLPPPTPSPVWQPSQPPPWRGRPMAAVVLQQHLQGDSSETSQQSVFTWGMQRSQRL